MGLGCAIDGIAGSCRKRIAHNRFDGDISGRSTDERSGI
jgi:hypothetical protein